MHAGALLTTVIALLSVFTGANAQCTCNSSVHCPDAIASVDWSTATDWVLDTIPTESVCLEPLCGQLGPSVVVSGDIALSSSLQADCFAVTPVEGASITFTSASSFNASSISIGPNGEWTVALEGSTVRVGDVGILGNESTVLFDGDNSFPEATSFNCVEGNMKWTSGSTDFDSGSSFTFSSCVLDFEPSSNDVFNFSQSVDIIAEAQTTWNVSSGSWVANSGPSNIVLNSGAGVYLTPSSPLTWLQAEESDWLISVQSDSSFYVNGDVAVEGAFSVATTVPFEVHGSLTSRAYGQNFGYLVIDGTFESDTIVISNSLVTFHDGIVIAGNITLHNVFLADTGSVTPEIQGTGSLTVSTDVVMDSQQSSFSIARINLPGPLSFVGNTTFELDVLLPDNNALKEGIIFTSGSETHLRENAYFETLLPLTSTNLRPVILEENCKVVVHDDIVGFNFPQPLLWENRGGYAEWYVPGTTALTIAGYIQDHPNSTIFMSADSTFKVSGLTNAPEDAGFIEIRSGSVYGAGVVDVDTFGGNQGLTKVWAGVIGSPSYLPNNEGPAGAQLVFDGPVEFNGTFILDVDSATAYDSVAINGAVTVGVGITEFVVNFNGNAFDPAEEVTEFAVVGFLGYLPNLNGAQDVRIRVTGEFAPECFTSREGDDMSVPWNVNPSQAFPSPCLVIVVERDCYPSTSSTSTGTLSDLTSDTSSTDLDGEATTEANVGSGGQVFVYLGLFGAFVFVGVSVIRVRLSQRTGAGRRDSESVEKNVPAPPTGKAPPLPAKEVKKVVTTTLVRRKNSGGDRRPSGSAGTRRRSGSGLKKTSTGRKRSIKRVVVKKKRIVKTGEWTAPLISDSDFGVVSRFMTADDYVADRKSRTSSGDLSLLIDKIDLENPIVGDDLQKRLVSMLLEDDLALVCAILDSTPSNWSETVARSMVTIFAANGKASYLVRSMLSRELGYSDDPEELFRASSRASKMFTAAAKSWGAEFLHTGLFLPVAEIVNGTLDVPSLDPSDGSASITTLRRVVLEIVASLADAAESLPDEFFETCSFIKAEAKKKFPGHERRFLATLVLQRYIVPCIAVPETVGLFDTSPMTPANRANLVMVAKVLIKAAQGTEFSSAIDGENMALMNDTVVDAKKTLDRLLGAVSAPPKVGRKDLTGIPNSVPEFGSRRGSLGSIASKSTMSSQATLSTLGSAKAGLIVPADFAMLMDVLQVHKELILEALKTGREAASSPKFVKKLNTLLQLLSE